jgi:hypothetical protein
LIAGLTITGFVFAQKKMSAYAVEVSRVKVDATASDSSLQTLKSIEKVLKDDQETVNKAKRLKHNSSLPQFKAIEDLEKHGLANELSLKDISFESTDTANTSAAAGATAPVTATPGTVAAPTPAASGVNITFKIGEGKVSTVSFVNFLYDIEHSTPKMQIKGISLKKGASKDELTVEAMTVTMLTKQ